jgi:predicted aspartyl protease
MRTRRIAPAFNPAVLRRVLPFILAFAAASSVSFAEYSEDLRNLYDGHHWFQLRDAVSKTESRRLYQGAVAAAFNQRDRAETFLLRVIAATSPAEEVGPARELLIHLYLRLGQYSKATSQMKDQMAANSAKPVSNADKAMFAMMSRLPDLTVAARGDSTLHYEMRGASLSVPLSVNEKPAHFLLDSDSNMSVISESEAKRLGMSLIGGEVSVTGVDGSAGSGARMAVAKDLVVGGFHFNSVAFLVLRDDQEPFVEWSAGTRGILGLPVILGFETLRWRRDGTIEIGFASGTEDLSHANLCFDNDDPIAQLEFNGKKLEFVLDTGGENSELWPSFAKDFAALLKQSGKKGSKTLTGYTGTGDVDVVTLPEVHLALGDFTGVLRPAPVLTKPTVGASHWYYGRVSMDILNQAHTVTIDFKAMTITLN